VGRRRRGTGACCRAAMRGLAVPLRSVLRWNRWRRPREMGWITEPGLIEQQGGFTQHEAPPGVRIELRIAYEPPASVLGAAIAKRLDWLVRQRMEHALERIRQNLES